MLKQQNRFLVRDMTTSILDQLLDPFWHRFHKILTDLSYFSFSIPYNNVGLNKLGFRGTIRF